MESSTSKPHRLDQGLEKLSQTTLQLALRVDSFIEALEDRAGDGRIIIEFRGGKIHHLELGRRFAGEEL